MDMDKFKENANTIYNIAAVIGAVLPIAPLVFGGFIALTTDAPDLNAQVEKAYNEFYSNAAGIGISIATGAASVAKIITAGYRDIKSWCEKRGWF